jgi:hypothetical protein
MKELGETIDYANPQHSVLGAAGLYYSLCNLEDKY